MNRENSATRSAKVLLVDDQPANLDILCRVLETRGYEIFLAPGGHQALRIADRVGPDLILLDVVMPDMDGFAVCSRLKEDEKTRRIPVIFITGRDLKEDIVAGFAAGSVDYITKPFQEEEVLARVQTHLQIDNLTRELSAKNEELVQKNQALEEQIAQRKVLKGQLSVLSEREAERWGLEEFVGNSPTMQRIFTDIRRMQESATTSVLITGESGTGKELVARAIHFGSARRDGPFVPVNCAAMPSELAESMLFGHLKGAFTGADADRVGYFEMAHEGTLFLDEIGEMPLQLQAKLLRVLEDGEVWRLGAREGKKVDFRLVAATNKELPRRIQEDTFRQDLYFRLARFTVEAPPLRQRRDDIPLLARHFLQLFAGEMGRDAPELNPQVIERLQQYDFPGNVRELKNVVERALIESDGEAIQPYHLYFLPDEMPDTAALDSAAMPSGLPLDLDQAAERAKLWVVKSAIAQSNGNISEAAQLLGTNRNRIYRILDQEKRPS